MLNNILKLFKYKLQFSVESSMLENWYFGTVLPLYIHVVNLLSNHPVNKNTMHCMLLNEGLPRLIGSSWFTSPKKGVTIQDEQR